VLTPVWSGRFRRDVKRAEKRGKDMDKLKAVMALLAEEQSLPIRYNDHPLRGTWKGFRDLHIEPDWLLLYRIDGDEIQFARTGTHADLFDDRDCSPNPSPNPAFLPNSPHRTQGDTNGGQLDTRGGGSGR
jgi:mRNA interferase YafQ